MYLHHGKKLMFLTQPRSGSRAVAKALKIVGFEGYGNHVLPTERRRSGRPLPLDVTAYETASTIRNHFDLMVSFYLHFSEVSPPSPFGIDFMKSLEILDGKHFQDGKAFRYRVASDVMFRFESLQEDVNRWLERYGLPAVVLPLIGASKDRKPYREYYDVHSRMYVEWVYGEEMKELNYRW